MNVRKAMPLVVDLPTSAEDRPPWVKVGIIAAIGFVIGVAWPRLAGVRLGPSVPAEAAPSAVAARADAPASASAPLAATVSPPASASVAASTAPIAPTLPAEPPSVTVNRGVVLSCKTEDGDALKGVSACGPVSGFDGMAQPRLRKLASCSAAAGASGKLSVVFNIDFPLNKVSVEIGKSSTVANVDGFGSCVRTAFQGVSLGALEHQNPRYALFYSVIFGSKDATGSASGVTNTAAPTQSPSSGAVAAGTGAPGASTAAPAPVAMDDSSALVVWEVAIVRDVPRTGQVLARLPRGAKVSLGAGQDGWFKVKYGSDLASEGWVYRGAIGR
jgi:hypothetical protein